MSDERAGLNEAEEAKLREGVRAWATEGREPVPVRERLAQLRAQAARREDQGVQRPSPWQYNQKATLWPAAAVAALMLGMLGFIVAWSNWKWTPSAEKSALKNQVAEDDNGVRKEKQTPPPPAEKPEDAEKKEKPQESADGAVFDVRRPLAKGVAVHVENVCGDIKIFEIDGDQVAIHAVKKRTRGGLFVHNAQSSTTITIDGVSITASRNSNGNNGNSNGNGNGNNANGDDLKDVTIDVSGGVDGDLSIKTVYKKEISLVAVWYEIGIPHHARIGKIKNSSGDIVIAGGSGDAQLETVSGQIDVQNTDGSVAASSSNGDIAMAETSGAGRLATVSGNIRVKTKGEVVSAHSSNGDITISAASATGKIETVSGRIVLDHCGDIAGAQSSNGDIEVSGAAGIGKMSTVSGNIRADHCGGAIIASTSNGEIRVSGGSTIEKLETVSGNISADVKKLSEGRATIGTSNGSIDLLLAADLNATVEGDTSNGTVTSSVSGITNEKKGKYVTGQLQFDHKLRGAIGNGTGRLKITAISGDISVKPMP